MKAVIVHVRSDLTAKLDCGSRGHVSMARSAYMDALRARNVTETIKLHFGERARLCTRCRKAA